MPDFLAGSASKNARNVAAKESDNLKTFENLNEFKMVDSKRCLFDESIEFYAKCPTPPKYFAEIRA